MVATLNRLASGQRVLLLVVCFGTLSITGCASQESTAQYMERQQREAQQLAEHRRAFSERVAARMQAGEVPPDKPDDPGFGIVRCLGLQTAPTTLGTPMGFGSKVICGNSRGGRQILDYRQWYCGDTEDCVLGTWADGQPTFDNFYAHMTLQYSVLDEHGSRVDLQVQPYVPATTLDGAAYEGDVARVKQLLATNPDVNARLGPVHRTALIAAAVNGNTEIVKLLLAAGASPAISADKGVTALQVAAEEGHFDTVQLLIQAHADVNAKMDGDGNTPLMGAATGGHLDVVRLLIAAGANVNAALTSGSTALLMASYKGNVDVVRALVAAHANVNVRTDTGYTALRLATEQKHQDIVEILQTAGAQP